jgi:hypothetical protein
LCQPNQIPRAGSFSSSFTIEKSLASAKVSDVKNDEAESTLDSIVADWILELKETAAPILLLILFEACDLRIDSFISPEFHLFAK